MKNTDRFSFIYGKKHAFERAFCKSTEVNGYTVKTVYIFENKLKVTNTAVYFPDFDACRWVNTLENIGDTETELIEELWDCDTELPLFKEEKRSPCAYCPSKDEVTQVFSPLGANVGASDFHASVDGVNFNMPDYIFTGKTLRFKSVSGRSSDGHAPFFNIHKSGKGYISAVGWTGQWNCHISRTYEGIGIKSKIEDTSFVLYPGEKIRTSSAVIMEYTGGIEDAQNKWRRFLRAYFSPVKSCGEVPFSAGIWGGMESREVVSRTDTLVSHGIPTEYVWMDAGWYGADTMPTPNEFEGDWASHTGDWRISPHIHPQGMRDVAEKIRRSGKKFLLWLEPERVRADTPIVREHPEYFLSSGREGESNFLLDLGNENAWKYCFDTLCGIIESLGVRCYRQDFNFYPLSVWRNNDAENRRGITEIKHITGLYRLWDALRGRFPELIIDNCASGGKRIDVETLSRSVPLWRSDVYCPANYKAEAAQMHMMNYSLWMPYSGTGSGRSYDIYSLRSAYACGMRLCHPFSASEPFDGEENLRLLAEAGREYLSVRKYFDGDVYRLTGPSCDESSWCVLQWDRPEYADGMIQIFKRENSIHREAFLPLRKIDAQKTYIFKDIDGEEFSVSGEELLKSGLAIRIEQKRAAKIFIYKTV